MATKKMGWVSEIGEIEQREDEGKTAMLEYITAKYNLLDLVDN